jgi:hypothetical protein
MKILMLRVRIEKGEKIMSFVSKHEEAEERRRELEDERRKKAEEEAKKRSEEEARKKQQKR